MTTLTQKIEALKEAQNSLINNFRKDRSEKKLMDDYRSLDAQIKELKKEENLQNLKKKIGDFNEANDEVKKVIPVIMEYKENILKVDGRHTKKFDNFINSIKSNFSIYAVKRLSFSDEIEIILQHKNRVNFKIYFENGEYKIYENQNIDFNTVIEARRKHNELLKEMEDLKAKISDNFQKANGGYILTDGDNRTQFLNI